jgi:RNA polymerase sigma-70 factor (ECF subfamily)
MGETFWPAAEYQPCVIAPAQAPSGMLETEVIGKVSAGRRDEALELIVRAFKRKVFGLALSYLRDRGGAEDVAQEVFIKVWKALPQFDGRATLSTWIYTITRNTSFTALRGRRDSVSLSDPNVLASVEAMGAKREPSAAEAEGDALLRLVERLPEKQRQVVTLFYMQEQSHEEVSAMLAMPVGTVKTLLHRARERLKAAQ